MSSQPSAEDLKRAVGEAAAARVQSGFCVGLGSGSTAAQAIAAISRRLKTGDIEGVSGVATSHQAAMDAHQAGIPLALPHQVDRIDMAIDGADEVSPGRVLLKGGGGAQVLEKIVASMARTFVCIVDDGKVAKQTGSLAPVPVEVVCEAVPLAIQALEAMGGSASLRMAERKLGPVVTDLGNFLLDARFESISDPVALDGAINSIPGVLGHGIFCALADTVLVAGMEDGHPIVYEYSG